jgi:hypothetical protein
MTLAMETPPTMSRHPHRRAAARASIIVLAALLAAPGAAHAQQLQQLPQVPQMPQQSPRPPQQQPPQQGVPQANICEAIDPAVAKTGIANWSKAAADQQGQLSILELVPNGQSNKDWTEMMTIQTFGQRRDINIHAMIDQIQTAMKGACAGFEVANQDDKPDHVNIMLLCRDPDPAKAPRGVTLKKHEVMWLKGMRGLVSTYLVQRAWHSDVAAKNSVFASPDTRKQWQTWADSVTLCSKPCAPNAPNPCLPQSPGQRPAAPAPAPKK